MALFPLKKKTFAIFASLPVLGAGACLCFNYLSNTLVEFLLVNKPAPGADVLIVEGWLSEFKNLIAAINAEFKTGTYRYILISGKSYNILSKWSGKDSTVSPSADLASALMEMGVDSSKIKVVEINAVENHKTFSMAKVAKKWLDKHDPTVKDVNVCSAGAHGRKTWWAYRRTLGAGVRVGILSFSNGGKPASKWLERRCGTRWLLYTFSGYLYAKSWPLSFIPD